MGQLYENPVTGERGIVRVPPVAANDGLLVADLYLRPGGAVAAEHVHPHIAEAFTVVRGHLQVRHNGHELQVGPGDRTLVAPGVAHEFWNAGAEETYVVIEVRPGQRFEQMIRQTFLAAQDGRTDAKGRPRPLQGAMLLREFANTMVLTSPPPAVQKLLFAVLHPIAA